MGKETTTWVFNYQDKGKKGMKQTLDNFDKLGGKSEETEEKFGKSTKKMGKSAQGLKGHVKDLTNQFPLLGRAVSLAKNPLVLAGAAFAGITIGMVKATKAVKEFDHNFLELKNLNLDKSDAQISKLRDSVLDLSFDKGLDVNKTTKAFFDVQSATGKYGEEVDAIVGKVGTFARVMKADFNETITGASKAMGIFGFGADKMDEFLASSAAVIQGGIATFDELVKVQSEFASATAAVGQGFNEGNKVFVAFSKLDKNVDIAATKTRGFFEDLTKLDKIDIDIFDDLGNFRKVDAILGDVNKKFDGLNDKDISKLIEQVGGNEGLRGMLKAIKNSGDEVLQSFEDFDNFDFDFDQALENANGDLESMSQIVDGKLSSAWVRLGDTIKPILITVKSWMADTLDWFGEVSKNLDAWDKFGNLRDKDNRRRYVENLSVTNFKEQNIGRFTGAVDNIDDPTRKISAIDNFISDLEGKVLKDRSNLKNAFEDPRGAAKRWEEERRFAESQGWVTPDKLTGTSSDLDIVKGQQEATRMRIGGNQGIIRELKKMKGDLMGDALGIVDPEAEEGGTSGMGSGDKPKGLSGIEVGGGKIRNVTVNITNLINELLIQAQSSDVAIEEIADKVSEVLVRGIRDAELVLSSE